MAVNTSSLNNQERGLALSTREGEGGGSSKPAPELKRLRRRIDKLKATTPQDPIPHCGECFRRGWKAALEAIGEE